MQQGNSYSDCRSGTVEPYWVALQVKTNHEYTTEDHLLARNCEPYLPLYRERRQWSDRTKHVQAPLFPGYLFCRYSAERRVAILSIAGVIRILGYDRYPTPVSENEITAIQRVTTSGLTCTPSPYLQIGDPVRIQVGSLAGLDGLLTGEKKNGGRFVVSVALLQRSVQVEIDPAWVA